MLREYAKEKALAATLIPRAAWRPYPTVADRPAWKRIPADMRRRVMACGEASVRESWPTLPATLYLEYARNGNRVRFETPYFKRRKLLAHRVLAECLDGKGRFGDAVMDAVWAICEESSWVLPSHVRAQKAGVGLPDPSEPIVDLFSAETGALLAWTLYLLEPLFESRFPRLVFRIRQETEKRVLEPCLERDDFWWMGFGQNRRLNNWTPWINSNWLACALLLEDDARRRVRHVGRILRSLDHFVSAYPQDGGCDEGPLYWGRAGGSLFDCLELLHSASGGSIDCFQEPLVRNIGRFIYRAHIHNRWFVNFADAAPVATPPAALVASFGRRTGDAALRGFGAFLLAPENGLTRPPPLALDHDLARALRTLFTLRSLRRIRPHAPLPADVWLPDTQVMVARSRSGSEKGFTIAVKGGHNAESHNHNDVGNFILYADGLPVLIDVGVETYSRKTFGADRYTIWTMQSPYHNVPTVGDVPQAQGRAFGAAAVRYAKNGRHTVLSMDLSGAYPPEAGLSAWCRTLRLERPDAVVIEDRFDRSRAEKPVTLNLMTPCRVSVRKGILGFARKALPGGRKTGAAQLFFDPAILTAAVDPIAVTDPKLAAVWGPSLVRIRLTTSTCVRTGTLTLRISPPRQAKPKIRARPRHTYA